MYRYSGTMIDDLIRTVLRTEQVAQQADQADELRVDYAFDRLHALVVCELPKYEPMAGVA